MNNNIIKVNEQYWNNHADLWFGATALPEYGVHCPTEDDLHLFITVQSQNLDLCQRPRQSRICGRYLQNICICVRLSMM